MKYNELGIYIHIPFCKRKCYYCDFVSYANKENIIEKYIESIEKEIDSYIVDYYNVTTIYIGGGTPSSIDSKYIMKILNKLKEKLVNNKTSFNNIEITIEINPGTVTKQKLEDYIQAGINRVSIGLQTTNNTLLKQIGRIHTKEEFFETYRIVKQIGFKNINADLMIGLPNQTIQDVKDSLQELISLNLNHISVYSLIIEENTKIEKMISEGKLNLPEEEIERNMYWYVKNKLELSGYKHYEISNYAKKGYKSKHNLNCWNQNEYIGLGVAAHSYLNNIRYCNTSDLEKYIDNMNEIHNKEVYYINEKQQIEDKKKEFMLLGLRKIDGVSIQEFKQRFTDNPIYVFRKELEKLVNDKLITIDGNIIKLTYKGIDFANLVWQEFI